MRAESRAAHHNFDVGDGSTPLNYKLERKFNPGCFISVTGKIHNHAMKLTINLYTSGGSSSNIALHVNSRFKDKVFVMNSKVAGLWGAEERLKLGPLVRGREADISLVCDDKDIKVSVNDR